MADTIYVTHIEAMGPFLKVCGQTDRVTMADIENTLRSMHVLLMTHRLQPVLNEINSSDVYLVQVNAEALFRRCHALHVTRNGLVKVFLIDYGQELEVHVSQMQLVIDSPEGSMLLTVAPQVQYGVLAGVYVNNLSGTLAAIRAQMGESMYSWQQKIRVAPIDVITLFNKAGQPIIDSLIYQQLVHPIALSEQANEIKQYLANEERHNHPHFAVDAFSPGSADGNVPPQTTRGLVPSRPLNSAPLFTAAGRMPRHLGQQAPPTTRGLVPARPLKLVTTHSHHDPNNDHISISSSASSVSSTTSGRGPPRNLDYHPSIAIAAPPPKLLNGKVPPPTSTLPKAAVALPDAAGVGTASSCHMPTFNSNTLLVKSRHTVYVSYIEDGPSLFSVQLKAHEHALDQMMAALGNYPLQNLHSKPLLGMACVVRYSEDSNMYRAVIMNIRPTSCLVAYVDYGHTGDVPFASIYQIPVDFLRHQIFAMRFTLTGYQQLLPLSRDVERLFRSLVLDADLELIVRPLDGPPCVQYCELYTHRGQVNVFERLLSLQSAHRHFAAAAPLREQELVVIRCIESAKQFYVQPCHSLDAYEQMMRDLQVYGRQHAASATHAPVRIGEPCMVWHKLNKEWNRAEVVELQADGDQSPQSEVIVQYVDIGSVDEACPQELLQIPGEFLTLPRQVVECCLESFVNVVNVSKLTLHQMEMLADREDRNPRFFTVNLCASLGDGGRRALVVNLIDSSVTPILDLSQRVFMMCMPPKQFRAYEQQRFQRMTNERARSDETAAGADANVPQPAQVPFTVDSEEAIVNSTQLESPERSPQVGQPTESHKNNSSSPINAATSGARSVNWRDAQPESSWRQHHLQQQMEQQQARRANEKTINSTESTVVDDRQQQQAKQTHKSKEMSPNAQVEEEPDSSGHFSQSTGSATSGVGSATSSLDTATIIISSIDVDLNNTAQRPVSLSYWKSPYEFYVQPKDTHDAFVNMMQQMQDHYRTKMPAVIQPAAIVRGAYVVCRKGENFFRAQLVPVADGSSTAALEVLFFDTGDRAPLQADNTWPMDRAFVQLQRQAIRCSLSGIVQTVANTSIAFQVHQHMRKAASVNTVFVGKQQSTVAADEHDDSAAVEEPEAWWTDVIVDGQSLRQLLILDGMLMAIPDGVTLKSLIGQTVVIDVDQANGTPRFTGALFGCKEGQMLVFAANESVDAGVKHLTARIDALNEDNVLAITALNAQSQPLLVNGLLQAPFLTDDISVQVVQVDAANVLYLQNVAHSEDGNQLLEDMFEEYETNGAAAANQLSGGTLRTRQLCAGHSLEDGNWYRCVVERLSRDDPDGLVTVRYIDYGNCERLPTAMLCHLLPKYRRPDTLAMKCYLALAATDVRSVSKVGLLTQGMALELTVLDHYAGHAIVDISCRGRSLVNVLRDFELAVPIELTAVRAQIDADVRRLMTIEEESLNVVVVEKVAVTPPAAVEPIIPAVADPVSAPIVAEAEPAAPAPIICNIYENRIECYLSHTDRPDRFYLRRSADEPALDQMQENIQIVAASLPDLEDFTVGTLCIVKYSGDDLWYRACIIDSGSGITSVQFIDYGNTDTLTQPGLIKAMNDAFRDIRPFAIACMLPLAINGVETRTEWPDEACQMLRSLLDERLAYEYLTTGASSSVVSLWAPPDRDVSLQLVLAGHARPVPYIPNGQRAFVSHSNSLSDFYIQMESETNSLEIVAEYLTSIDQFEPLQTFEPNTICTARYEEDGEWYRARILSHSASDGTEVLFIDYGNTSTVRELRVLRANIAQLPHLSKHCTLQRPADVALWSDEAERRFVEIANGGETVFQVNLVMPSSRASTVQMLYAEADAEEGAVGTDLSVELSKLCDKFCMAEVDQLNASVGSPGAAPASAGVLQAAVVFRASGPQDICVRLHSHREQLTAIVKRLAAESADWPTVRVLNAGDLCAARSAQDGQFHRAIIAQISSDGHHLCDLFDENLRVVASDLRVLPADLAGQGKCYEQYQIATSEADGVELTTGDECHVQLIDASVRPPLVRLFADGQGEREIVRVRAVAAPIERAIMPLNANQCLAGYLTTIDSSAEFWAQLAGTGEQSLLIGQRMEVLGEAATVQTVEVGQLYAAKFEDDGIFYRAKVTSVVEKGSYEVLFIDYGNVAVATHLCELDADLAAIPPLATRCALSPADEAAQLSETLNETTFGELPMDPDSTFHFKIVEPATPGGTTHVRMFRDADYTLEICVFPEPIAEDETPTAAPSEEENVAAADPVAAPVVDALAAGTDFAAPISWTNSWDDFFVQPYHLNGTIAQLDERMQSAPAYGSLADPKVGDMCAAQFVDDDVYYRARILAVDSEKKEYNVLFVDYGNDSIATDIRVLPDDLRPLEVCAVRCRLAPASAENGSSAIAEQEFVDLVVAHAAEMHFQVQESLADRLVVRMWTDEERKSEVVVSAAEPALK